IMGYVGDDVMKDWIQINYHTGSGKYADALAGAWQVHQDNCTNPPLNDRWYNNQTEPYLLYGTLPDFFINGENTDAEWPGYNADFLNTGNPASDWDENYYALITMVKRVQAETTPITMSLNGTSFLDKTASIQLSVTSTDDLSAKNLRLYVGVLMDSVAFQFGPYLDWGEWNHHNEIFVGWVGDKTSECEAGCENGQEITLAQDTPVDLTYSWTLQDAPTGTSWDPNNMVIFAFIQDFTALAKVNNQIVNEPSILQGVKMVRRGAGIDKSAPALTFNPYNNQFGVAVNSEITITFDEKIRNVDDSALDDTNVGSLITLKKNDATGDDISKTVTINSDKTLITINPTNDFSAEQRVYVAIGATVEDEADNAIQPVNITFTTVDNTAPTATIVPADAATGIAPSSNITISFNEPVRKTDDSALDNSVVTLKKTDASGDAIAFTTSVDAAQKVITVTPSSGLGSSQTVYVCVNGVEDNSNNALAETCATFTTADADAPTVNMNPQDGATDVAVDTKVTLTFSETVRNVDDSALDDDNVDARITFKYEDANGSDIPFDATIDSDKKIVTLAPDSNLDNEKKVYVAIGATVEDASNNAVSATSATFTTVAVGNTPVISAVNDTAFAEDRYGTVNVIVTDANGDNITFSVSADTSAVEATVEESNSISSTQWLAKIKLKPEKDWNGESVITVFADDGTLKVSRNFKLTVYPVDDAPSLFDLTEPMNGALIKITDQTFNDTLVFKWTASTDAEGDTIEYKFSGTWGLAALKVPYVKNATETKIAYADIYAAMDQSALSHWTDESEMTGEWGIGACAGMYCVPPGNGPYELTIYENVLSLTDNAELPNRFDLHQNYPNPFNPVTSINYQLAGDAQVTLTIYDIMGQKIRTVVNENQSSGFHSVLWDGKDNYNNPVSSGVYIYRIHAGDYIQTRKMILMR
ncbi:MAG TPA: T9SS type A sorting domain-containing protein, partial [Candidatus Marinimicrobia bacterium]|nr:T9SS type A sorting domain-containing protein [Candidatus Neomarinimicrobiota bacterium]